MATTKNTGRTTAKGTKPSGTTRKRPADRQLPSKGVTSAKQWKSSARTPVELELPSGNVCLALNKGMQAFIDEGTIPNSLMPLIMGAIEGAEKGKKPEQAFAAAAADESLLTDMLRMCDAVVLACVRQPEILPALTAVVADPDADDNEATTTVVVEWGRPVTDVNGDIVERDDDCLYVDDVDMQDKMFVFQWAVGGTANVEKFREEFAATMEDISSSEAVE